MKILVVDDTRIILSVVEAILTQERHAVFIAADGHEGYDAFVKILPDMVITDIEMPWQDGLSMMRVIRQKQYDVATLYMTGNPGPYQQHLDREQATYGAETILKPFTRSELLQAVADVAMHTSRARTPFRPAPPQPTGESTTRHPVRCGTASLSAASFQQECRYGKAHRFFNDSGNFDGILVGSGR